SATYNANNQLSSRAGTTFTYDANGNLTSDGTNVFVWDARNQLASMNSGASTFQYDAFGRRVSKSFSGSTTSLLYDGLNSVQELQGSIATANILSGGLDEVLLRTDSEGPRNFLVDAIGSTVALADATAALQTQYTYDAFGKTSTSGSSSSSSVQFTGRQADPT